MQRTALLVGMLGVLAGCATNPMQVILKDPAGYAAQALADDNVPSSVLRDLHLQPSKETVRTVRVAYDMVMTDRGFGGAYNMIFTYAVRDNGLVQTFVDGRQNGISVVYEYVLGYGPVELIDENAYLRPQQDEGVVYVRDIKNADPMLGQPRENAKFNVDAKFSFTGGPMVSFVREFKCFSSNAISASKLSSMLTGKAVPYYCETYIFGTMASRSSYYYLTDYGVHINDRVQNERGIWTYKIKSVEFPADAKQMVPFQPSGEML